MKPRCSKCLFTSLFKIQNNISISSIIVKKLTLQMHSTMNTYDGIGYVKITEPTRIIRNFILLGSNIVLPILTTINVMMPQHGKG